jgi:hypothetical protein
LGESEGKEREERRRDGSIFPSIFKYKPPPLLIPFSLFSFFAIHEEKEDEEIERGEKKEEEIFIPPPSIEEEHDVK